MMNATKTRAINNFRVFSLCSNCPVSTTVTWQWPPRRTTTFAEESAATTVITSHALPLSALPAATSTASSAAKLITSAMQPRLSQGVVTQSREPMPGPPISRQFSIVPNLVSHDESEAPISRSNPRSDYISGQSQAVASATNRPVLAEISLATSIATTSGPSSTEKWLILSSTPVTASAAQSTSISTTSSGNLPFSIPSLPPTLSTAGIATHTLEGTSGLSVPSVGTGAAMGRMHSTGGFIVALIAGTISMVLLLLLLARLSWRCCGRSSRLSRVEELNTDEKGSSEHGHIRYKSWSSGATRLSILRAARLPPMVPAQTPIAPLQFSLRGPAGVSKEQQKLRCLSPSITSYPLRIDYVPHIALQTPQTQAVHDGASNLLSVPISPGPGHSWRSSMTTPSRKSFDTTGRLRVSDPFDLEFKGV